ncbi:MAG: hypothetical protein IKZ43_05760 [Acidaminococcaceae bacterium]|nr:hypothetical protein [Acidaminococcaceae bacterium]
MKKILLTALAAALLISSAASAANLMIDENSKVYSHKTAVFEINDSITAVGTAETGTMKITIKPFFHSFILKGNVKEGYTVSDNGLPYKKPKSMLEKTNGYIFKAKGKEAATESLPLAGVVLTAENKVSSPLVIDLEQSVMQLGNYSGRMLTVDGMDQGALNPSKLVLEPKQSKTVLLFRTDGVYHTPSYKSSARGYFLPATPVDFNKLHAEVALHVGGMYVTVTADGAIPEAIQKKYDQAAQMAAK